MALREHEFVRTFAGAFVCLQETENRLKLQSVGTASSNVGESGQLEPPRKAARLADKPAIGASTLARLSTLKDAASPDGCERTQTFAGFELIGAPGARAAVAVPAAWDSDIRWRSDLPDFFSSSFQFCSSVIIAETCVLSDYFLTLDTL